MSVIHHDTVQLYASEEEFSQGWTRPGGAGSYAELTSGGRAGAPSIRPKRYGRGIACKEIGDHQVVGIHVSFRVSGHAASAYGNPLLVAGALPRFGRYQDVYYTSNSNPEGKPADLLSVSMESGGNLLVEHVVQTSTSSSSALNRLVLGDSGFALVPDHLYSLEAVIDVSGETARIAVWLDSVSIVDAEFPRDRVSPYYSDDRTDMIQYVGLGGYASVGPDFSDIVVYDSSLTAAPIGPVSVKHYPLDNPAFALPINDATTVEIPDAGVDLTMPGSFPTSGPVIGAYLAARTMPSADEEIYSTMFTVTRNFGEDFIFTSDGLPGGGKSVRSYEIEGVADFADLDGLNVNARST